MRGRSLLLPPILLVAAFLGSCERPSRPIEGAPAHPRSAPAQSSRPASPSASLEVPRVASAPLGLVTDPAVLSKLERAGYDLATLLGASRPGTAPQTPSAKTSVLVQVPAYQDLVAEVRADVESVRASDPLAGEDVARFSHRLFDVARLTSAVSQFELVGLVNRLDRRPFHRSGGACGEVRLIYRLAYETVVHPREAPADDPGKPVRSRLPMTIGLEFPGPSDADDADCRAALARFSPPVDRRGDALAEWLVGKSGPLQGRVTPQHPRVQIVTNVQVVRWPSTVHPSMAGHVEYALRAFRFQDEGRLVGALLENTPDVARLSTDRALLDELVALVTKPASLRALDEGTLDLPDKFLTKKSVSVAPRGLSRRANRPYRSLLTPADFQALNFEGLKHVRSGEALVRRLDELSCAGCHQSRSVAGFHLLGEDGPQEAVGNALVLPFSPHVEEDLPRRLALFRAIASDAEADYGRAFAERAGGGGGYGAHCGLGGEFRAWSCDEGLSCDAYDAGPQDRSVGICLPVGGPYVGDPCEVGVVTPHKNGRRDRVTNVERRACVEASCNKNAVGFPGGLCRSTCESPGPHGTCGAIAMLGPFNACLARHEPFTDCLKHAAPAGLRACGPGDPCRDDFICARKEGDAGMCLPPYFLFQLRVDGHP